MNKKATVGGLKWGCAKSALLCIKRKNKQQKNRNQNEKKNATHARHAAKMYKI